jgi:hypothetical protein
MGVAAGTSQLAALFTGHFRSLLVDVTLGAGFIAVLMAFAFVGGKTWEGRFGESTTFRFDDAKGLALAAAIVAIVALAATAVSTWA